MALRIPRTGDSGGIPAGIFSNVHTDTGSPRSAGAPKLRTWSRASAAIGYEASVA